MTSMKSSEHCEYGSMFHVYIFTIRKRLAQQRLGRAGVVVVVVIVVESLSPFGTRAFDVVVL